RGYLRQNVVTCEHSPIHCDAYFVYCVARRIQEPHVTELFTILNGVRGQFLLQDAAMPSYIAPIVVTPRYIV
ncbi:MAG: hypothetical protein QGI09_08145, partial [Dehalococcoidia bacterium]|nr:hypothetical protein [Dehalococcoidia bacterium]